MRGNEDDYPPDDHCARAKRSLRGYLTRDVIRVQRVKSKMIEPGLLAGSGVAVQEHHGENLVKHLEGLFRAVRSRA